MRTHCCQPQARHAPVVSLALSACAQALDAFFSLPPSLPYAVFLLVPLVLGISVWVPRAAALRAGSRFHFHAPSVRRLKKWQSSRRLEGQNTHLQVCINIEISTVH